MSCREPVFTGTCTALVTPFYDSGGLNTARFASHIDRQIQAGVSALCVCGTTGEAAAMTEKERLEAIAFCCQYTDHRVKVIAGTGSNSTAATAAFSRQAQEVGADALLIVTPYYNKPTQTGLLRHYTYITERVDLPILLYNVPSRTGVSFTAETYRALAKDPRINGVKEASADLALLSATRRLCGDDFSVWSGSDDRVVPMMALGSVGVISVASNLLPERMVRLTELCLRGDFREAARLQLDLLPLVDALFRESNPIPVKTAMELMGLDPGPLRLPLCEPSPEHRQALEAQLRQYQLLS